MAQRTTEATAQPQSALACRAFAHRNVRSIIRCHSGQGWSFRIASGLCLGRCRDRSATLYSCDIQHLSFDALYQ